MIYCEITVEGRLHPKRLKDFEGLEAFPLPEGRTRLSGSLPDQSALFSVLNRIRDMNLQLISLSKRPATKEDRL